MELKLDENDILYILEILNLEYYFNIKNSLPNGLLKNNLIKYSNIFYGKWLDKYFEKYININFNGILSYEKYLDLFRIEENNNEEILYKRSFDYINIIYDKLLYILKICINHSYLTEVILEKYFIIIQKILDNKIKTTKDIGYRYYAYSDDEEEEKIIKKDENDYFEENFAFEVFKILYEYIITIFKNYVFIFFI